MITKDPNKFSPKYLNASNEHFCPKCGSNLMEADRCNENQSLYVWYKCSRNNCDGQWLQKIPHHILK